MEHELELLQSQLSLLRESLTKLEGEINAFISKVHAEDRQRDHENIHSRGITGNSEYPVHGSSHA